MALDQLGSTVLFFLSYLLLLILFSLYNYSCTVWYSFLQCNFCMKKDEYKKSLELSICLSHNEL